MSAEEASPDAMQLDDLRRAFDETFRLPPPEHAEELSSFVLLEAGGHSYAVALSGLLGLQRHLAVVPVPARGGAVLGLAALRGSILPVFDLALLLGDTAVQPGWWQHTTMLHVRAAAGETLGLAFDRLLQFARVPASAIHGQAGAGSVLHEQQLYPVVLLAELVRKLVEEGVEAGEKA